MIVFRNDIKSYLIKIFQLSALFLGIVMFLLLSGVAAEGISEGNNFAGPEEAAAPQDSKFQLPSLQERISQVLAPVPLVGLDPHYTWEQNRNYLLSELYYYLFEYDHQNRELKPQLAADYPEIQQDEKGRKEFSFDISSGFRFASGREIEARDVKYSLLRLLILDVPGSGSGYLWQVIFGVNSLENFLEKEMGYGIPETLSSEEAIKVYSRLTERIQVQEENKLIVKPKKDYNLIYLFSDLVPWAAVVDRRAVKNLGGWDGREENWAFYHRTRADRNPPLQNNNKAGRYELRVINFQPGKSINLQKISEDSERAGIISVFDSRRRAGVERAIEEQLYDFIQLTSLQQERYRDVLRKSGLLERELSISDSQIYLIAGRDYNEDKTDVELIYYRGNQQHQELARQVSSELGEKESDLVLKKLDWQSYTARLFRGDFELAVMEWLHPFPEEIIPPFLTRDRYLADNVIIMEKLKISRRYLYGEL